MGQRRQSFATAIPLQRLAVHDTISHLSHMPLPPVDDKYSRTFCRSVGTHLLLVEFHVIAVAGSILVDRVHACTTKDGTGTFRVRPCTLQHQECGDGVLILSESNPNPRVRAPDRWLLVVHSPQRRWCGLAGPADLSQSFGPAHVDLCACLHRCNRICVFFQSLLSAVKRES